jgi:hypothetical protein
VAGGLGPRFALEAGFLILLAAVAAYARLSAVEIIAVMAGGWLLTAIFEAIAATRERLYPAARSEIRVEEAPAAAEPEPEPKRRRSRFRRAPEAQAESEAKAEAPSASTAAEEEARAEALAPAIAAAEHDVRAEATAPPSTATDEEARAEAPAPALAAAEEQARAETPAPASAAVEAPVPAVEAEAPTPAKGSAADDEATGEFEPPPQGPRRWLRRRHAEPPPAPEVDLEPARPSARHVRLIRGSTAAGTERATQPPEDDDEERKDAGTGP